MKYEKFQPDERLKPFVECYFIWEGFVAEKTEVQSPPLCFGAIVINYGDPTWAYQHSDQVTEVPEAFVCGLFTSNYHRVLKGKIGMAGIVFKATALHDFFGLRMSQLVNNRMHLDLLLGRHDASHLTNEIQIAKTDRERIEEFNRELLLRLDHAKSNQTVINEVLSYIDETHGQVSIDDVALKFRVSRRYIEKHFLEKVGVSPKFYSRVRRFNRVLYNVLYKNQTDWQDVVFENGFHDQSHLTKDFMEFNHMNPSEYYQNHKEMTRYVKR